MIYRGLEEFGNILSEFPVRGIVEPTQFGDAAHELDEAERDKVLERGSVVRQISQDVIPNIDPLGDGEVIPVAGDEFRETVGCHEERVLGLGSVEYVLALGDEGCRGLEGEEAGLGLLAGDFFAVGGGFAGVERFAEGFYLG